MGEVSLFKGFSLFLFWAALALPPGPSPAAASFAVVHTFLTAVASLVERSSPGVRASAVAAPGAPECRVSSCGLVGPVALRHVNSSRQGLKPVFLHWQMDSYPLCHQRSPGVGWFL